MLAGMYHYLLQCTLVIVNAWIVNNLSLVNIFGETGRFFYNINYMLNSEHLSLVNKIGDKTEFTITRVHCTCLYIERVGMFMFTKCLSNSLQKMKFLTEGSKILNWFVWIFLIEFCKELKRKFVNQFNVILYHQDGNSLKIAKMVAS